VEVVVAHCQAYDLDCALKPKFHLARLDSTRRARLARLARVESRRAKWNLGLTGSLSCFIERRRTVNGIGLQDDAMMTTKT